MGMQAEMRGIGVALLSIMIGCSVPQWASAAARGLPDVVHEAETAGFPSTTLNRLLALAHERSLDPRETAHLLTALVGVQRDGLPLQPFVSKVEEGFAKRVPVPRIVEVLEKKAEDYRFARSLMSQRFKAGPVRHEARPMVDEEIRFAELLNIGLNREDLARLIEGTPDAPLPGLIRGGELLGLLTQIRFDSRLGWEIVSTGLRHRYFHSERTDMGRIISAARLKGTSDQEIAAACLSVIRSNASLADLAGQLRLSEAEIGASGPRVGQGQMGGSPGSAGGAAGHGGSASGGQGAGGAGSGSGGGGGGAGGGSGGGGGAGGGGSGGGSGGGGSGAGGGSGGGGGAGGGGSGGGSGGGAGGGS